MRYATTLTIRFATTITFRGTLHETDLMTAYNRALVEIRHEEHSGNA